MLISPEAYKGTWIMMVLRSVWSAKQHARDLGAEHVQQTGISSK